MTSLDPKEQATHKILDKISTCFGKDDGHFAMHPNDEARARELQGWAHKAGITDDEFKKMVVGTVNPNHRERQKVMEQIDDFFDSSEHN